MTGLFSALAWVRDPDTVDGLSPSARHLLNVLVTYTGRHGTSFPSVDTLAELMGVCRRTVQYRRAELVAAGVIEVRYGGSRHTTNTYLLRHGTMPEVLSTGVQPVAPLNPLGVQVGVQEGVQRVAHQGGSTEGDVITPRDASRAVPPWIAQGVTWRQWVDEQAHTG